MSKSSGLGAALWVDGVDLSGDTVSLQRINSARGVLPSTGIDKLAMERTQGLRDGGFEVTSWFNPAAAASHATWKTPPAADRIAVYCHRTTLGASAAACVGKQFTYDGQRGDDGSFTHDVTIEGNAFGLEWGNLLTAGKRTDTGATNGASIDTVASVSFGLQAYLQVFSPFTGTDITIKIQDSADNVSFADVTGAAFTAVTAAPTKQRIQTGRTATVRRYLRVATTTSAGFTSATFGVVVVKNGVSTVF